MRILHILDHSIPLQSGYSFRTLAILREQNQLGWETMALTGPKQSGGGAAEEQVGEWRFYRTPAGGRLQRLPLTGELAVMTRLAKRIRQVAAGRRPDIIHAHSPLLDALPALYVGRRLGVPVVYEIRAFWEDAAVDHGVTAEGSLRYRATRALETWACRQAHQVATICAGLRRDLIERGIPADKITVIPNAVDIETFTVLTGRDRALAQRFGLDQARVLGFVGSFYAYEGLALLLRALPGVLAQAPDVRLLLVGGGPQETALKQLAQQLALGDKVIFTGRTPHEQVGRYYSLIDILVYPRLAMRLTELVTPLKPLEAMAQGKLLAASDVGGHRELIQDGVTGVLFRSGDVADLTTKLLGLLARPDQGQALRDAARRFVETERTWSASVARYRQVYKAVLERTP